MPSGSAVRGNVHVLRVGSLQGYEVHAFATLLRHLANIQPTQKMTICLTRFEGKWYHNSQICNGTFQVSVGVTHCFEESPIDI